MANNTCFDSEKYIKNQSALIRKRLKQFNNKLYMEFGGKLFDDLHASRVLPGFDKNVQIRLLESFKDECEVIFVISAIDIESGKIRADNGITYDMEVLRLINKLRTNNLMVSAVVITLFNGQESALNFKSKLENMGERVYLHYYTKGYPTDIDTIVSENGYGKNPYIETSRPLVAVTAPGPGSGKLATCLSQLYHEYKRNKRAGYAKFEKFPVYNLPLSSPINVAYEAATADLGDKNVLDHYHFDAYRKLAVSYNRDIQAFPIVKRILDKIASREVYKSPTDMGINTIKDCIFDLKLAEKSAKQEIIRRYLKAKVDYKKTNTNKECAKRIKLLMDALNLSIYSRPCVKPAEETFNKTGLPAMSLELTSGDIIVGVQNEFLSAPASCILKTLNHLGKIDESFSMITDEDVKAIRFLKKNILSQDNDRLSVYDILTVLSVFKDEDINAKKAMRCLPLLKNSNAHSTHILQENNEETLKNLGILLTSSDRFSVGNLFDN